MEAATPDPHLRRDIAHSLSVTALACVASGGLLYLVYLGRTLWVAARSRHAVEAGDVVLVFGKRLRGGEPDRDFEQRLRHAHRLAHAAPHRPLLLLGGAAPGEPSEAAAGLRRLRELGLPETLRVELEDQSQDTLQNLRHARQLLGADTRARVLLLSNRYHLARCARLARQFGFEFELCAAEPRFAPGPRELVRLAGEAAYLCWLDVGTRWARLIRHRRMLARVS